MAGINFNIVCVDACVRACTHVFEMINYINDLDITFSISTNDSSI